MKSRPTPEQIRAAFSYDPETGVLTRLHGQHAGPCGTPNNGYLKAYVGNTPFSVHVLAWVCMTGKWPVKCIDHRDGDGTNNRWKNLRLAGAAVNRQNLRRAPRSSRVGLLGVSRIEPKDCRLKKPYRAAIKLPKALGGRSVYLGMFATPEEAHAAYVTAKRDLHEGCTL